MVCADSPNPRNAAAYPALEEAAAARAGDAGRFWTWATAGCASWPAVAADRYRGPWNRPTAHPLLLVGTKYDPATPYADAQALAGELADARLLTHEGYGHTALINPSSCVKTYESRYLVDGTLPPAGTTCRQDKPPSRRPSRRWRDGRHRPLSRGHSPRPGHVPTRSSSRTLMDPRIEQRLGAGEVACSERPTEALRRRSRDLVLELAPGARDGCPVSRDLVRCNLGLR